MKFPRLVCGLLLISTQLITAPDTQGQTYEVYDQDLKLKSRVEYDHISILGESVRVSTANDEIKLLGRDYKPFLNLKASSVYCYDQPWLVVQGKKGKGVFHEYGEEVLAAEYDEIQTYFNLLLAKKDGNYYLYEHGIRKISFLGDYEDARLIINGHIIAKTPSGYLLPLGSQPDHIYDSIELINEKYFMVKEGTGYGLLNRDGDYVLQPVIDSMVHLEDDYFYAQDGNQFMLIRAREVKAEINYTSYHKITLEDDIILEYIHGKLRRVMNNSGILLDQTGMEKVLSVGEKHTNIHLKDKTIGLLGPKGWVVRPIPNVDKILPGNEGLFGAIRNGKYGFLDKGGKWIVEPTYEEVRKFHDGIAAVKKQGMWSFINTNGNLIGNGDFEHVTDFVRGIAIVKRKGKHNLIDKEGQLLLENDYERISKGVDAYFISEKEGLFGLVAPDGKEIVTPKFQELRREDLNKILVRIGDKYGILDEKGDYVLPVYYKNIVFDTGNKLILAEDKYQFTQDAPVLITVEATKKKKGG